MSGGPPEVDVLIVGAGITRHLPTAHRARGRLHGDAAGSGRRRGPWLWNRYRLLEPLPPAPGSTPRATRTATCSRPSCSTSGSGSEHFAEQPEIERYLNHVVDKFDLRRDIAFGARVTSATWDDGSSRWTVTAADGRVWRAQFLVAATGVLSVPFFPDVPGRDDFTGVQLHTGLWPAEPVDLAGKRVAVVGTGSSGVQIVPVIADGVASLSVYQRSCELVHAVEQRADHRRGAGVAAGEF